MKQKQVDELPKVVEFLKASVFIIVCIGYRSKKAMRNNFI